MHIIKSEFKCNSNAPIPGKTCSVRFEMYALYLKHIFILLKCTSLLRNGKGNAVRKFRIRNIYEWYIINNRKYFTVLSSNGEYLFSSFSVLNLKMSFYVYFMWILIPSTSFTFLDKPITMYVIRYKAIPQFWAMNLVVCNDIILLALNQLTPFILHLSLCVNASTFNTHTHIQKRFRVCVVLCLLCTGDRRLG